MGATSLLNVGTADWACAGTATIPTVIPTVIPTTIPTTPGRARATTLRFMHSSTENPFVGPQMVPLLTWLRQKRFQLSLALAGDLAAGAARFAQPNGDCLLPSGHALARAPGLQSPALPLLHCALHLALCFFAVLRHASFLRGRALFKKSNTPAAERLVCERLLVHQ